MHFKKIIVISIIFLPFFSVLAYSLYEETNPLTYEIIEYTPFNIFKNEITGKKIEVSINQFEYNYLTLKNSEQPKLDGYIWVGASDPPTFKITNTILEDYQYYKIGIDEASSTLIKIKYPNEEEKIILLNSI